MSAVLRYLPFGTRAGNDPQTRINEVLRYRAQTRDNINQCRVFIDRAPKSLSDAIGDSPARNFGDFELILAPVVTHIRRDERAARDAEQRVVNEERVYTAYTDELVALHKRLAEGGSKYKEFTQDSVNELLAKVPDTVGVIVDDKRILLTYTNVKMVPSTNPYLNINNGKNVAIPMDTLTTLVNLNSGEVIIGGDTHREGGFRVQAHPHAMSASTPCLGGFEGTFYDACQKADIEVIALVLRFFLSQANQQDGAGKYWPRWMPAKILTQHDKLTGRTGWYVGNYKLRAFNDYLIDSLGRSYVRGRKIIVKRTDNGMAVKFKDTDELRTRLVTGGVSAYDVEEAFKFIDGGTMSKHTDLSRIW